MIEFKQAQVEVTTEREWFMIAGMILIPALLTFLMGCLAAGVASITLDICPQCGGGLTVRAARRCPACGSKVAGYSKGPFDA